MSIADLTRAMHRIGLHIGFVDLRDIIWLAEKITPAQPEPAPLLRIPPDDVATNPRSRIEADFPAKQRPTAVTHTLPQSSPEQAALYGASDMGTAGGARRVQLRGIPPLPEALAIGRALRPLSRRRIGTARVLDERATAEFIADTGVRAAIWRPARERWFDIVLAVEEVPSLAAWRPLIMEFERLLRRQGGFRRVTRLSLHAQNGTVRTLSESGHEVLVGSIQDRQGRSIVLVASDCTSFAWRHGILGSWLQTISVRAPVALVQLLPQSLWPNTSVGFAELRTAAREVGTPTGLLRIQRPSWAEGESGVVMPVFALNPAAVLAWARMVTAAGDAWATSALLPVSADGVDEPAPDGTLSPSLRAMAFRASATPDAQRLAAYFSVVKPLTPPVMRVIHHAMLPASGAVALAEVFLGGLLRPVSSESPTASVEERGYDFHPGLRDLLEVSLTRSDFVQVNLALHDFLQQKTGTSFDFFALLEDDRGTTRLPAGALPFVQFSRAAAARFRGGSASPSGHSTRGQTIDASMAVTRLAISQVGSALTFVLSGRGQTETFLTQQIPFDQEMLQKLMVAVRSNEFQASSRLARMLVHPDLQDLIAADHDAALIELILRDGAEVFPWEVLIRNDNPSDPPLAVTRGLTRKPSHLATPEVLRATNALIVDNIVPSPRVVGVGVEPIEAILKQVLPGGVVKVRETVFEDASVDSELRVLYIAAHGMLGEHRDQYEIAPSLEIVLDSGSRLTLREFQSLSRMPELIFLNCDLAAVMAPELLARGAQVVVAPYGFVNNHDKVALTFATVFFEALGGGLVLIEAIREARRQCFNRHPTDETWGQFQCFGRADWRLLGGQTDSLLAQNAWAADSSVVPGGPDKELARPIDQPTIADFTVDIDVSDMPPAQAAQALVNRGITKHKRGDSVGAIADFTAAIELPEAPPAQVARAFNNRGVVKGARGDGAGAIADYTAVITLHGAPVDAVVTALNNRGSANSARGKRASAIDDFTAVIDLPDAPTDGLVAAYYSRGSVLGGRFGSIADFTAIIELPDAPPTYVARSLINRGVAKGSYGDSEEAIADFTAAIKLPDAPPAQVAQALVNRGMMRHTSGDSVGAVADFTAAIELPEAPPAQVARAFNNRGVVKGARGDRAGAIADYKAAVKLPGAPADTVEVATRNLTGLGKQ